MHLTLAGACKDSNNNNWLVMLPSLYIIYIVMHLTLAGAELGHRFTALAAGNLGTRYKCINYYILYFNLHRMNIVELGVESCIGCFILRQPCYIQVLVLANYSYNHTYNSNYIASLILHSESSLVSILLSLHS